MIEAINLGKLFEDFVAVADVSMHVGKGELLALLGPNGAGKTTTVRMLSAILKPSRGRASIAGHDVVTAPDEVRRSIGMLTEQPGLYSRMSGIEYLTFYGRLYGMNDADTRRRSLSLFDRFAMKGQAERRLGEYSKGMRQKVGIIRAMLHNPSVLLLDEPTSAMDPHSARLVRDAITELRNDERAIILCTHNLPEAEQLADRIAIIRQGDIVAEGSPAGLKRQLLGQPLFSVKLDRVVNGEWRALEPLVAVTNVAADTIHFNVEDPGLTNPRLVQTLHDQGMGVVALQEVTQSLEDVYLRVVGADGGAHQAEMEASR